MTMNTETMLMKCKRIISSLLALILFAIPVLSNLSLMTVAAGEDAYVTVQGYEEFGVGDSIPTTMISPVNMSVAINTNGQNKIEGEKSVKISSTSSYPAFTFKTTDGSFEGDGLRFWVKTNINPQIAKMQLVFQDNSKKTLGEYFKFNVADEGGYYTIDYDAKGLTKEQKESVVGVYISFNFTPSTTKPELILYMDDIQVLNPLHPPVVTTYQTRQGFESFAEGDVIPSTTIQVVNMSTSINTDTQNVTEGEKSVKISSTSSYPAFTMKVPAGSMTGDGMRFWVKTNINPQIAKMQLIFQDNSKKTLGEYFKFNVADSGGYYTIDYEAKGLTKEQKESVVGIYISFNFTPSTTKPELILYMDDIQVINPPQQPVVATYQTRQGFESFAEGDVIPSTTIQAVNMSTSINTDAQNVIEEEKSLKLTSTTAYPAFTMKVPAGTMVGDGVRFWVKYNFAPQIARLQLVFEDKTKLTIGEYCSFDITTDGGYYTIDYAAHQITEEQQKALVGIYLSFNWVPNETKPELEFYLDDIQVINPEFYFVNLNADAKNASTVSLDWNMSPGTTVSVWHSEQEMNAENFAEVAKTEHVLNSIDLEHVEITGLEEKKTYYFAIQTVYEEQSQLHFVSAAPWGAVYDFEKSNTLADYTAKTNSGLGFSFINGGYGCSGSIANDAEYCVTGNAYKMSWDETTTGFRWPILYMYAPNFGDYAGDGFSVDVSKTLNQNGEAISVPVRVELQTEDGKVYVSADTTTFPSTLFPRDVNQQTMTFSYDDFWLSTDDTKTERMTREGSVYIKAIRFFFQVHTNSGYFDLYFDNIKVVKPYGIERPVEEISFTTDVATLTMGEIYSQTAVIAPFNAVQNDLVWSSSNEECCKVEPISGLVTAEKYGIAIITATAPSGVTGSYRVVVKDDERGASFRVLYDFENGELPGNMKTEGCKATLDYSKSDTGVSLKLEAASQLKITLPVEDYALYGEGMGLWMYAPTGGYATISLNTKDGKRYSREFQIDNLEGIASTVKYELFRLNGTGEAPSRRDIVNFKEVTITYTGTLLYIDSIRVKDPMIYNVMVKPETDLGDTQAEIKDINSSLGTLAVNISQLTEGVDYSWALSALYENKVYSLEEEVKAYSIYFIDEDYKQQDLSQPIQVTLPIPYNFVGLQNIWVLYVAVDGTVEGLKADILNDTITFLAQKSGVYCMVGRSDDLGLKQIVKSKQEVEITPTSDKEAPKKYLKKIITKRIKKKKSSNEGLSWYVWTAIGVGGVAVLGTGTFFGVRLLKKRKAKITDAEVLHDEKE